MNGKILALLGFASKSGNLSFGMDAVKDTLKSKKSKLVLTASDISEKSFKEISFHASAEGVEAIRLDFSTDALEKAVGHKGGILSVNESGFAKAIKGGTANG